MDGGREAAVRAGGLLPPGGPAARHGAVRRLPGQGLAPGRARLLQLRPGAVVSQDVRRQLQAGDRRGGRIADPHRRRQLHPPIGDRPSGGDEDTAAAAADTAAHGGGGGGDGGDRHARGRGVGAGRRHASDRGGHRVGGGGPVPGAPSGPWHPHGDHHRRSAPIGGGGSHHRQAESDQPGKGGGLRLRLHRRRRAEDRRR